MIDIRSATLDGDDAARAAPAKPDAALPAVAARRQPRAWPIAKRIVDVLACVVLLILVIPLLLVAALLIKRDSPGPMLFRQERLGRHGKLFTVLKLRTMRDGASPELHRRYITTLATGDQPADDELKKLTGDPRVTRVGAFLRRTSIDELPQLVNVLRGEMSIVGPRPALDYELEFYRAEHFERFDVRPGLTGLWQVSGRNQLGFLPMLSLDAQYARTSGPRVDGMILLRTPLTLLRKNAA